MENHDALPVAEKVPLRTPLGGESMTPLSSFDLASLGSHVDYLFSLAFEYHETLDPAAKHRTYRQCKLCGGTDEDRDHYKPSIQFVQHKDACLLPRHRSALVALPALLAVCQDLEAWCRVDAPELRGNPVAHNAAGNVLRKRMQTLLAVASRTSVERSDGTAPAQSSPRSSPESSPSDNGR